METGTAHTDMASEPVTTRPLTSYADVMAYLHSIRISQKVKESVGRRLVTEATEPHLAEAFARLDHLSQLEDDWDGYGGRKVSYHVLQNLRNVLLISDDEDWKYWMISPDSNGCLGLQSKRHTASISIGDEKYSYYSENGAKEDWADNVNFTPSSFLRVMRRIV